MTKNIPNVENMNSPRTNKPVANQFIIKNLDQCVVNGVTINRPEVFQSYDTVICVWGYSAGTGERLIFLDRNKWDYSATTLKYLKLFLGVISIDDIRAAINLGTYYLTELN